tara:strand:+ start:43 stop:672 length:630 start_codon:yes stop_codon:yes gene_type:complete
MNGKNRNKPCYCGSGLKTKKCWKNHFSLPLPNGIELPKNYEKPIGWGNDLGLVLHKKGVKNHKLCFSGVQIGGSTHYSFPTIESDIEKKNTTFLPKSSNLNTQYGVPIYNNSMMYDFGHNVPWMTEKEYNENYDDGLVWTIYFKDKRDKRLFKRLHDSDEVFVVNVEVGDLRINNTFGHTEYYCELEFKDFEFLDKSESEKLQPMMEVI